MDRTRTRANVAAIACASLTLLTSLPSDSAAAGDPQNQPRALPLISRQSPWLVDGISWRAPRAGTATRVDNGYEILVRARIAVQPQATAQSQTSTPDRRADFLFGRPRRSVSVRGNWLFASANSDLFDFVTNRLTIDKKDFNAPGFGVYFSQAINSRLDVQGGYEFEKIVVASEYRDLVDNNFNAIEQDTSLKTSQLVASLRYALTPRGRDVSRFAYVPSRVVPYVGAGGGAIFYNFEQTGDFVDYVDLRVFPDVFRSSGWAPTAHAFAGVDLQVYRALYTTVEGRYTTSSAKLSSDFVDFDPIDLSGFKLSAGFNLVF